MSDTQKLFWVHFFTPVNGKTDYFFSSKKAIYKLFTKEQIGLTLGSMYSMRFGSHRTTDKCIIRLVPVIKMGHDEKMKEE